MGVAKEVRRVNLQGLAKYICTKKSVVYDRQRGQEQGKAVAVLSEYDRWESSEAFSGPLRSGIIIFK